MGSLNCISCENELVRDEDLCLYMPVKSESHLCIKFELAEQIIATRNSILVSEITKDSDKHANIVRSAEIKCMKCAFVVGFRIHCGPNHDSILCISLKATFNLLADGLKVSNLIPGGASARKKLLEGILDVRSVAEFYGTRLVKLACDVLTGSLKHPTIEDLSSVNISMLIKDRPRSYQLECFCAAALFPSIIQIPTGSGKTLISVMLASLYKRLNPGRMVWFLTDRIPLVFQQARYIEEQTSLTVLPMAGEVQTNIKPSQLIKYDVLVCTVQLLINMLLIGQIRIEDVSLVIIDEVHHATRNHPYVVFIETFLSKKCGNDRPRLLGLTASPAAGNPIQMKLQLKELSRLCGAQLFTPCLYRDDLSSAVNRPNTKFITVNLSQSDFELFDAVLSKIRRILADESCPCTSLEEIRSALRGLSIKSRDDSKLAASVHLAYQLLTALEMTSILGSRYSRSFLSDLLRNDEKNCELETKIHGICENEGSISPKSEALCQLLNSIDLVSAPETRMIIFVETKRTARWLASFLQEQLASKGSWNPTAFTGQASNSVDGMSWDTEQRPILALFRSGHVKLLIATSVLQEGLDVAACNHIVLFDRTWSLKAFLQSRGRARAQDSEYTIICSADDQNYYSGLFQQEMILTKMVRDEMVDGQVLSLDLTMTVIYLNVKCKKLTFTPSSPEYIDSDKRIGLDDENQENEENAGVDNDNSIVQYSMTLNLHNFQNGPIEENSTFDLSILSVERIRDHLPIFSGKEEVIVCIEIPSVILKRARSWISMCEEILDPLLTQKYPGALIELNNLIPEIILGSESSSILTSIGFEMQKLASGALDSGNKFIEAASQHHSFTPTISLAIFDVLSFKIGIVFQESEEKTFRIEIPFDSVDAFCLLSRSPEYLSEDSNFSLVIPMQTAPLLYFTAEKVSKTGLENRIDELYWERVTSDSFSERFSGAFSLCPALRLDFMLNGVTGQKLLQVLSRMGSTIFYTCNLAMESFPEYHSIWSSRMESLLNRLDFETQYKLRTVMSETWSSTSLRLNEEFLVRAAKCSWGLLEVFCKRISRARFADPLECLLECEAAIISKREEVISDRSVDSGMKVKLITWTPSKLIHHAPTLFLSNRVLREFGADYFIRVHFRDEDLSKLSVLKNNANIDNLLEVGVRGLLKDGIVIGQRKFEFLAMSSSQLRNHGCWFVDVRLGAELVRKWLGSFEEIKNVAKYVARLGQSFSASRPTLSIPKFNFIPDWEHDGFCFSDGCGMISLGLATEIATRLRLSEVPSAFQIRYAGFKGVVSVAPESEGLTLRPSMKKFESDNRSLDILNVAQAFPCFLNRQVIMILSALGVPDSAFELLQLNHLKYLAECFNSTGKLSLKHFNISDLNSTDPFVRSLISAQYRQHLSDLLLKSRIALPKGRILMGVVDESGTLAENEIFCQIRDEQLNEVVVGSVVIAKNPCMHPGDVRVLKAVKSELLERYSYNVIVFSRHGPRPVPNMCSGSDLDGDLYFVTWDQSIIPPTLDEPMVYDGLAASVNSGPITSEDLKSFMVFFIKNDQLGAIANTHVAFADQFSAGVRDPACISLAKLFSLAVDFPKTGFVARIPKEVRVERYPDFMQKPDKPAYSSRRVIGNLFREVKAIASEKTTSVLTCPIVEVEEEYLVPGYEEYLTDARRYYEEYCSELGRCLLQYGFRMESHLFMNCTMAIELSIREIQSDVLEIAQLTLEHLSQRFQELFYSTLTSAVDVCTAEKVASAWYYVTYSNPITPMGLDAPILSFPWIIKTRRMRQVYSISMPSLDLSIALDLKKRFIKEEQGDLVDLLSQSLLSLNQVCGCLNDPELRLCIREFFLTRSLMMFTSLGFDELSLRILKVFPSAIIKRNDKNVFVKLTDSINVVFSSAIQQDLSPEYSSHKSFLWSYLMNKTGGLFEDELNAFDYHEMMSPSPGPFENLIKLESVPNVLRLWMDWIGEIDEEVCLSIVKEIIRHFEARLDAEIDGEKRISYLRLYHSLIRTCRIDSLFKVEREVKEASNNSVILKKTLTSFPTIMRKMTDKTPLGPTGSSSVYVQGAYKLIFRKSLNESDALRFEVYEGGPRHFSHLTKTCFRILLRNGLLNDMNANESFAFNEFWTHSHRQLYYLSKFGGSKEGYGKLRASVNLGSIYATELPRMFIEQSVNIWLARVAMEKSFRRGNLRNKKTTNNTSNDLSQFKYNPRNDVCIKDSISSDMCTESLQSLLNSVMNGGGESSTGDDNNRHKNLKKSKFGRLSTAFNGCVSEERACKLLKKYSDSFIREDVCKVSLVCYDEGSNTNSSLTLSYSFDGRELRKIGRQALRWLVLDISDEKEVFDSGSSCRVALSSSIINEDLETIKQTIFADGIVELCSQEEPLRFKVKEPFRSNQTIYCRALESYSKPLNEDFTLTLHKVSESYGLDPSTGLFALNQEKWEIGGKFNNNLVVDQLMEYRQRDRLIYSLWAISKQLKNNLL